LDVKGVAKVGAAFCVVRREHVTVATFICCNFQDIELGILRYFDATFVAEIRDALPLVPVVSRSLSSDKNQKT
jgi:hypothetical protein